MSLIDADGRITDKDVNDLGMRFMDGVIALFNGRPKWSIGDKVVTAYHLQGYITSAVSGQIIKGLTQSQDKAAHNAKLVPPAGE